MKKHLKFLLLFVLLATCLSQSVSAEKFTNEILTSQTRTYNVNDPKIVMDGVINVLKTEGFSVKYKNKEIMYIIASKHKAIKNISIPLLAVYAARTCWDTIWAVLTYGVKSYSLVGDIIVIGIEFKDKDLETLMGINIKNQGNKTDVTMNIDTVMIGKRDGLPVGKKNRLETIHVRDTEIYNNFFDKLNEELESKNNTNKSL